MALKSRALDAVKLLAAGWDSFRRPDRGVVVLLYHRVGGGSGLQVDLDIDLFTRQMEVLAERGAAVSLDEALASLASPDPPERDPVVVTFDDGTADYCENAVPVMERFGIPSTVYVATDFIDRGRHFPHEGRPASWPGLRDASATGLVTVGSHTHTHALLDRLPATKVQEEIDRSISLIEDNLGLLAHHFAYPKAVLGSREARALVRHRFRSAALGGNAPNRYGITDPHRLTRSSIQTADGMRWFRHKLAGGMALEETLRGELNRYRYAGTTS